MGLPREQLARLLRRRRRSRLLLLCLVVAVACGAVAEFVRPKILIGGMLAAGKVARAGRPVAAARTDATPPATPLDLDTRLGLDPREEHANALRWQDMSAGDRRALLDRYWHLAGTDAERRTALFNQYKQFRQLPPERRMYLRDRARKLKAFMATLSPQDQAVLEGMTDEARARRLLELWRASYGEW